MINHPERAGYDHLFPKIKAIRYLPVVEEQLPQRVRDGLFADIQFPDGNPYLLVPDDGGIVVLVAEERHDDHRLPKVGGLVETVQSAVRDERFRLRVR